MSPRPKTAPDADILDAAARLLCRLGPARMRLEDVARAVGLAPATLLLRFKSKKGLLLAVAEHGIGCMAEYFRDRRASSPTALHALASLSECMREVAEEPHQLANFLAFHQLSLEDADFRAVAHRHDAALEREVTALLDEARDRGELIAGSTRGLARAAIALVRGSLLTWSAIGQRVAPDAWIKADLETLLAPYSAAGRVAESGVTSARTRTAKRTNSSSASAASRARTVGRRTRALS